MGRRPALTEAEADAARVRADKSLRALAAEYGVSENTMLRYRARRTPAEQRIYMLARMAMGWRVRAALGGHGADYCGRQNGGPANVEALWTLRRLGHVAEVARCQRFGDSYIEAEYEITEAGRRALAQGPAG